MKPRPIRIEGDVAYVPLTQGYEAIIDAVDVPRVRDFHWHALVDLRRDGSMRLVYAVRKARRDDGRYTSVLMHRELLGLEGRVECDHADSNGINNRRANLRPASHAQNLRNTRPHHDSSEGLKGVTWHAQCEKWQARIMARGKRHYLGLFATAEEACAAYAEASRQMHGEFGRAA